MELDPRSDRRSPAIWETPSGWTRRAVFRARSPEATEILARLLADTTVAGDCLLLSGDLGAGKSHFARAFIRHAMGPEGATLDIPSPTFTLVQTYDTGLDEIWHADLYRLSGSDEVPELGLDEAMETARCIIEWPERLAPDWPAEAVILRFETDTEDPEAGRRIGLWSGQDAPTSARVMAAWPEGADP